MPPTGIAWTDETWNPIAGCSRVSPGCEHCYAERMAYRLMRMGQQNYEGLTVRTKRGARWTREVRLLPGRLLAPWHLKTPARIFVNSMSDLFHEAVPFEFIAAVFAVMSACHWHTFQVLTKRPERMREWYAWIDQDDAWSVDPSVPHANSRLAQRLTVGLRESMQSDSDLREEICEAAMDNAAWWPPPNIWIGASVEDQQRTDRLLDLVRCPASIRFVSVEPLLERVRLGLLGALPSFITGSDYRMVHQHLHQVIVGGESGPAARPCDVRWIEHIAEECADAQVACFVKQLGSKPVGLTSKLRNRKGSDPTEWPRHLRVREWPEEREPT